MSFINHNFWNYCTGDKFVIDQTAYRFVRQDARCVMLETVIEPRVVETFSHEEIYELGQAERLVYKRDDYSLRKSRKPRINDGLQFADLPEDESKVLLWKKLFCDHIHKAFGRKKAVKTDDSVKKILPKITKKVTKKWKAFQRDGKAKRAGKICQVPDEPAARTLLRWYWDYEDAGFRIEGLRSRVGESGNSTQRFEPGAVALLTKCIQEYATRRRKSQKKIAEETEEAFTKINAERREAGLHEWKIPKLSAVRRAIKKMDAFYVYCQRRGLDAARKKYALFERGVPLQFPGEHVEIDEGKIDLMTLATTTFIWEQLTEEQRKKIPRQRRWMYVAICATTKCILAIHICKNPSGAEAVKCLALATRDKSDIALAAGAKDTWHHHCGMSFVSTDQGSAFLSFQFAEAMAALGADHDTASGATPWLRGFIERVFGTFNTDLFQEANGRVFSNPVERGGFDSEGTATLTDDMLAMMLVRYVVDVYHNRPHEGLNGETPNNAWDRLSRRYPMCPPPLPKNRRAIFGLNVRRKVRGNGVLVCGIQYRCDQLDQLFLRRSDDEHHVKVRINPENIGTVDVLIDGMWFPAKAVGGGFDGIRMDLWIAKVRAIRQYNHDQSLLKRHVVLEALADIRAMNNEPFLLMDMTPFGCTAKQINRAEKSVFLGLEAEALSSAEMEKHFVATSFKVSSAVSEAAAPEASEVDQKPECPTIDDEAIVEASGLVFHGTGHNG